MTSLRELRERKQFAQMKREMRLDKKNDPELLAKRAEREKLYNEKHLLDAANARAAKIATARADLDKIEKAKLDAEAKLRAALAEDAEAIRPTKVPEPVETEEDSYADPVEVKRGRGRPAKA